MVYLTTLLTGGTSGKEPEDPADLEARPAMAGVLRTDVQDNHESGGPVLFAYLPADVTAAG